MIRSAVFSAVLFVSALLAVTGCEYTRGSNSLGPGPIGGGASSSLLDACVSSDAETVVRCVRATFDHMNEEQLVQFLKASAHALNRSGIAGGPYGVLRKQSGNNCAGYSCDIVCAGQGEAQRQHDVLLDAEGGQEPTWGPGETWPDIRVDVCEIQ